MALPWDHASLIVTLWPRLSSSFTTSAGMRFSIDRLPGKAGLGQKEDAKCVDGLLNVYAEIDSVKEDMERPLVLAIAAGGAKYHEGLAVLGDQRRGQRGPGTLSGR